MIKSTVSSHDKEQRKSKKGEGNGDTICSSRNSRSLDATSKKSAKRKSEHVSGVTIVEPFEERSTAKSSRSLTNIDTKKMKLASSSSPPRETCTYSNNNKNKHENKHENNSAHDPWEDLGLGSTTGSVALNEYLRQAKQPFQHVPLSAQETLFIVSTLRAKTWPPPRNSPIYQNLPVPTSQACSYTSTTTSKCTIPITETNITEAPWMETLSNLYNTMVAQDADDGISYRKNLLQRPSTEIVSQLRTFENRITDLARREDLIVQRKQELQLIPGVTMPHYMDYYLQQKPLPATELPSAETNTENDIPERKQQNINE